MKARLVFVAAFLVLFIAGCSASEKHVAGDVLPQDVSPSSERAGVDDEQHLPEAVLEEAETGGSENHARERTSFADAASSSEGFRLEIPTAAERETLPACDKLFTAFPVAMDVVTGITPLGNLGPPGHTFPTDHPHMHVGEHGSNAVVELYAPADVYVTLVSWGDGMTQDPRDYTIYFALCGDVIGYYNHVKTLSPALERMLEGIACEGFSQSGQCTKVVNLKRLESGERMGTVGHGQGNFDFGLIDLRVDLDFIKPERYPERSRHIQCPFDYYTSEMKRVFYGLINRDDASCSTTMQDVPGTLQGNWFHESAPDEQVVAWDTYLAFVHDVEFSGVQVVSVAGMFTSPGKFEFRPRTSGRINRNFAQVMPGDVYCYESEALRSFQPGAEGKIIVQMVDEVTLHIAHADGRCTGREVLQEYEVYKR